MTSQLRGSLGYGGMALSWNSYTTYELCDPGELFHLISLSCKVFIIIPHRVV